MATVEIDSTVLDGLVDFVEQSVGYASKQAETEAAVAERGPQVVDTLISNGFVNADKKQAALRAVQDPLKVLESLEKTARAKVAKAVVSAAPETLGEGGEVKEAGVNDAGPGGGDSPDMQHVNRRFMTAMGF